MVTRRIAGRVVITACIAFLLLAAQPVRLGASAQAPTIGTVSSPQMATAKAVLAYWTPARMAAAIPRDLPTLPASLKGARGPVTRLTSQPVLVPGNEPGFAPGPPRGQTGTPEPQSHDAFNYPYPYNRYQVFPITVTPFAVYQNYPFKTHGKVFFTIGATNYVCSGTSVTSGDGGNQSLVWTAGHCVHAGSGGAWATNVVFVPAYRDGAAPVGSWTAYTLYARTEWTANGNLKEDFGVIVVNRRVSDGARLGSIVGTQGLATSLSDHQMYHSFGYPAAPQGVWPFTPFNGNRMWSCQAPASRRVTEYNVSGAGPAPVAIGCDMTGGSSGGAWLMGFNLDISMGWHVNGGYINGLNSWRWSGEPRAMHSPYHGSEALALWNAARAVAVPLP